MTLSVSGPLAIGANFMNIIFNLELCPSMLWFTQIFLYLWCGERLGESHMLGERPHNALFIDAHCSFQKCLRLNTFSESHRTRQRLVETCRLSRLWLNPIPFLFQQVSFVRIKARILLHLSILKFILPVTSCPMVRAIPIIARMATL